MSNNKAKERALILGGLPSPEIINEYGIRALVKERIEEIEDPRTKVIKRKIERERIEFREY